MQQINDVSFNLGVLNEQIYGYKHGIRPLILQTVNINKSKQVKQRLQRENIKYYLQPTPYGKNLNIYFGDDECINVVKSFENTPLNKLSPEKDFILGVLLGYDKTTQCKRYLKLKEKELPTLNIVA